MEYNKKKKYNKRKSIWSLYKGEENLNIEGTFKEIADKLGVKELTVYFYTTNTWKKRNKGKNHRELVLVERIK